MGLDLKSYYAEINANLKPNDLFENLKKVKSIIHEASKNRGRLIIIGNGGSASTASHAAVDFSKQAKIPAFTINDASLITALSNDSSFDKWLETALSYYMFPNDILLLLSVSGESNNLIKAAEYAKRMDNTIITFTGKNSENRLKHHGTINLWVNSESYNIVENIHQIWLTTIVDMFVGKAVYNVN